MITFLLFAEDRGHLRAVETLTDLVLCEPSVDGPANWITPDTVELLRTWRGANATEPFIALKSLDRLARDLKVPRKHGHFGGEPGAADAALFRKALRVALQLGPVDAVVIARDLDHARTRSAFEQAKAEEQWPFVLLFAGAQPEVEAWLVAGFVPADTLESERLAAVRQEIGFDPTQYPHELHSTSRMSAKDAKSIWRRLIGEREPVSIFGISLGMLRERGKHCGLVAYLDDVIEHVVPKFRHTERR